MIANEKEKAFYGNKIHFATDPEGINSRFSAQKKRGEEVGVESSHDLFVFEDSNETNRKSQNNIQR
jgi:hypothetical protein